MRKRIRLACLVAGLAALGLVAGGCMTVVSPAMGALYTDVKGPIDAGDTVGSKTGTACAQSFFALVATGDASIATAAANGGITKIGSVDHTSKHMLVVGEFCTVVHGS